jgi:hypothetical protein
MTNHVTKPEYEAINDGERSLYRWQRGVMGGFESALWDVILRADTTNLRRLAQGFPEHVAAYHNFAHKSGWWAALAERIEQENKE